MNTQARERRHPCPQVSAIRPLPEVSGQGCLRSLVRRPSLRRRLAGHATILSETDLDLPIAWFLSNETNYGSPVLPEPFVNWRLRRLRRMARFFSEPQAIHFV